MNYGICYIAYGICYMMYGISYIAYGITVTTYRSKFYNNKKPNPNPNQPFLALADLLHLQPTGSIPSEPHRVPRELEHLDIRGPNQRLLQHLIDSILHMILPPINLFLVPIITQQPIGDIPIILHDFMIYFS